MWLFMVSRVSGENTGTGSAQMMLLHYSKQQSTCHCTMLAVGKVLDFKCGYCLEYCRLRYSILCFWPKHAKHNYVHLRRHANREREYSLTGQGGNKLRSYRLFKKEFVMEPYLFNITSAALCVSMTRLTDGCHSLENERGRYHKPRLVQRLCRNCKSVEDEKHFLCECSKYEQSGTSNTIPWI